MLFISFVEKGVSELALPLLKEDDIDSLITVFGDRIVFKHHHKLFVQQLNNVCFFFNLNLNLFCLVY